MDLTYRDWFLPDNEPVDPELRGAKRTLMHNCSGRAHRFKACIASFCGSATRRRAELSRLRLGGPGRQRPHRRDACPRWAVCRDTFVFIA